MGNSSCTPTAAIEASQDGERELHCLEDFDYTYLPHATSSLKDFLSHQVQHGVPSAEESREIKSCLQFVLRHFVDLSLGTRKEGVSAPDSCLVSVGVIKSKRVVALNPVRLFPSSRPRACEDDVIYCWFIPLETVSHRICLLSRLAIEDLMSTSTSTILERIADGHIGYYASQRNELRLIPKLADICVSSRTDELSLSMCGEGDEDQLLVLFSSECALAELRPLASRLAVAFLGSEVDFARVVLEALGCAAVVNHTKITEVNWFIATYSFDYSIVLILDMEYLGSDGIRDLMFEMLDSPFQWFDRKAEIIGFRTEHTISTTGNCGYVVRGPMTVALLQSTVLLSNVRRRILYTRPMTQSSLVS